MKRIGCLVIALLMMAVAAEAQPPPPDSGNRRRRRTAAETMDVFDLLRKLRHKEAEAQANPGTIASR